MANRQHRSKGKIKKDYSALLDGAKRAQESLSDNERRILDSFFKLSAGGLGASYTAYSFLSRTENISWGIAAMNLCIYVVVILFDLLSSYYAKRQAKKLRDFFLDKIKAGEDMKGRSINELFEFTNSGIITFNWITFGLLFTNILFTISYTLIILFYGAG